MASAAHNAVAVGIAAPAVFGQDGLIVVGIFALDIVDLAQFAGVDQFLGLDKAGSKAADLPYHELFITGIGGGDNGFHVFPEERKGLFAQHMQTCRQRSLCHLAVQLVGGNDDHGVEAGMFEKIPVIGVSRFNVHLLSGFAELFLVNIADCNQTGPFVVLHRQHMALGHVAARDNANIQDPVIHITTSVLSFAYAHLIISSIEKIISQHTHTCQRRSKQFYTLLTKSIT